MIVFPTLKIFLTGKNIECVKTFEVSLNQRGIMKKRIENNENANKLHNKDFCSRKFFIK